MLYDQFNELIGEIQESLEKILSGDDPNASRDKYEKSLQQKYFNFHEECRINEKEEGPAECILHFNGLRLKFDYILWSLFHQSEDGNIIYKPTGEQFEKQANDMRSLIIKLKADITNESILYLSGYINNLNEKVKDQDKQREKTQPKEKAHYPGFRSNFKVRRNLKNASRFFSTNNLLRWIPITLILSESLQVDHPPPK